MRFVAVVGAAILLAAGALHAQEHPTIPDRPAPLKALDGDWVMSGDVMGEPVTYRMVAGPTLQGAFTEIHMNDVQVPSQYEARVLIGFDAESKTVIAHWMDSFGAKYSVPHGTGTVSENTVQFTIPYEKGAFRDTLTYDPETKTWLFVLEAAQPNGKWKHFARYTARRP
jgi:hypothetical protein